MVTVEVFNKWLKQIGIDIEVDTVEEVAGKTIGEVEIRSASSTDWFRFELGNAEHAKRVLKEMGAVTEEEWEREWER